MNRRGMFLFAMLLIVSGSVSMLIAQVEVNGVVPDRGESSLFMDAISFAALNNQGSRVDVFVQVGYEMLSFVKHGGLYDAAYEMTLSLFDSTNSLVNEKLWTEDVKGVAFDRSASPNASSITQRSFDAVFGRYTIRLVVRDKESGASYTMSRNLRVPDFSATDFSLSDIMLLSRVVVAGDKRSIAPSISPNVGTIPEAFFVYVEAYNKRGLDSVRFNLDLVGKKSEHPVAIDTVASLKPGRGEYILRVPHGTLPLGDYSLVVTVRPVHASTDSVENVIGLASRSIAARWVGLPRSIKDLDLAIEQVRYICKGDEMSKLKEAKTAEEKMAAFMEFWKKRDPNPNTPRNERMEEYFARVDYANKHFSHYIDGWRTDMGMVYVMFGAPNNVDRHPFDVDSKPYEVWAYYDLNYSFVFIDQTGFGDYRLETPVWEVWSRVRN
jgi:GWxTD domain-containing protein